VLALATASLAPMSNLSAAPGPQPTPTTVGAELDGRAYAFLLSDHEREREERADRDARDHRPTAKSQPTKTKPKTVEKRAHVKAPQNKTKKKRVRAHTRPQARPAAPTRVNGSRARAVVNFALAQVGKPYRWASDGPGSYDCSGLVKASFARIGIHLPHQTGQLVGRGRRVSRSALQPGDIVFPSSGHVGIYLGRGKMVHAPKPGDHVRVATMYGFWTARRLL
jgi:cell wall-associated NlpC family hydrolase